MPEFTRYKKRISYRFSHRFSHGEKKSCVFSAAGSLTSSSSVPRRPPPPDGVSGLRHPRCTPPTSTFFPLLTFFFFFTLYPFFQFLFFFLYIFICTFFFSFSFYAYLYVHIAPCFRNATASTTANFISVHMLVCAFFFSSFVLYMLGCIFLYAWIPLHAHSFFMYTLAYIFNFTKCICLPDVVYFFMYIFMCIFCC